MRFYSSLTLAFLFLSSCAHTKSAGEVATLDQVNRVPASIERVHVVVGPLKPDPKTGTMGQLVLLVCHDQKCYDEAGSKNASKKPAYIPLAPGQSSVTLDLSLEAGEYVILIDHDRTNHGVDNMPKCHILYPVDGIGFTNNVDPRDELGKPDWESVKLNVVKNQDVQIHPLYLCDKS